jgi:hypothetical protein
MEFSPGLYLNLGLEVHKTGTNGYRTIGRFQDDVSGPLVPVQDTAGTKGPNEKPIF